MIGMPREPPPGTAFVKSYDGPSTLLLRILVPGLATPESQERSLAKTEFVRSVLTRAFAAG